MIEYITKYKKHLYIAAGVLLCLVVFCAGWKLCKHYHATDKPITGTMDEIQTNAGNASVEIRAAGEELRQGQDRIKAAQGTADRIAERNGENAALIDDCKRLLDDLRSQYTDIENANRKEAARE